ncbi:MAG TPA: hypothetical protein PK006_09440 [Saprospiraceae bacterium]|nr:hypothetical protein [Saprospiraceae bacterium]
MASSICIFCKATLQGRSDKKFCSINCKNQYNYALRQTTKDEVKEIDAYLHRNREILSVIMGNYKKLLTQKVVLERAGFRFEYMTGIYHNKENKRFHYVYDYAWAEFTNQELMLVKKSDK